MLYRKTKVRLYVTIIRSTLLYGSKAWMMTKQAERNLRTFKNRKWRKICGPVIDETIDNNRQYKKRVLRYVGTITSNKLY